MKIRILRVTATHIGGPDDVRVMATRDRFETHEPGVAHQIPAHEFAFIC